MSKRHRGVWALAFAVALSTVSAHAQFGVSKTPSFGSIFARKTVSMHRRLPPVMNISGKTVQVQIANGGGATGTELQGEIENLLTRTSTNVRVVTSNPDVLVQCTITLYAAPKVEKVYDATYKTTTEYIQGALNATFRITLPRAGTLIASGNATAELPDASGPSTGISLRAARGVTSTTQAEGILLTRVSRQVAEYLVQTDEQVLAMIAVAQSLTPANKLAEANLWSRNLEELQTMSPFPDPKLDAYRVYNIGVANEVLAYQAEDPKAALKYLQQASIDYGKALADKPDEKYFLEPQNRIKIGLAHYLPPPPDPSGGTGGGTGSSGSRGVASSAGGGDAPITNADVIQLVQAKMDQANILDTIQQSPKVDFDLSVQGQIALTRAGVNGLILTAMKNKARGEGAPPAAPAKPAQPPATRPVRH